MPTSGTATTLIRGATILSLDPAVGDLAPGDLLLAGEEIQRVEPRIDDVDADEVIDAQDCIVIPGFVDTHRHMWEALLRGIGPQYTLPGYFGEFLLGPALDFGPREVHLGNLLSAQAALHSGITTVQDISNIHEGFQTAAAAVEALQRSGLRAVFAYGKSFSATRAHGPVVPDAVRRVRHELLADDTARVTLALDTEGQDDEADKHHQHLASELGVRVARHVSDANPIGRLHAAGSLVPGTTFIHGNGLDADQLQMIVDNDGGLSVSAAIEMIMGHGYPEVLSGLHAGARVSLSADVETTVSGDMFTVMRAAYQAGRHRKLAADDAVTLTPQTVLHCATRAGAETLGLGDRIGTLTPGKQADLVVLRADRPDVAPVVDPYSAVVLQMDRSHVDTVLAAGEPVARGGTLTAADDTLLPEARDAVKRLLNR